MVEFVAAPMRQWKGRVALANAGQLGEIGQPVGDKMDHFALLLNAPAHRDHAGPT